MYLAVAILVGLLAIALACIVGAFRFALRSLDDHARCSVAYSRPGSRLLLYHVPLTLLTFGSVLLMPNRSLAIGVVLVVVIAFLLGGLYTRRAAVQYMATYLRESEGLDPSTARRE